MATSERSIDIARREGARTRARLADELRRARRSAGLSQTAAGAPCGVCLAGVVGLDFAIRTFPAADALREAGHARLLGRFRQRLHPNVRWRTEVPLPIPGDRRAWDGLIEGHDRRQPVEAETVIADAQATERKLSLKLRDGGFDDVILVVADTPKYREALAAAPAAFSRLDTPPRDRLAALGAARDPRGSGIVLL